MLDDGIGATRDGEVIISAELRASALDAEDYLGAHEHTYGEREYSTIDWGGCSTTAEGDDASVLDEVAAPSLGDELE